MITEKEIENSIRAAEAELAQCQRRRKKIPEGKFRVRERDGRLAVYQREGHGAGRREKYCSLQNDQLVRGAIDSQYVPAVEAALLEELELLHQLQGNLEKGLKYRAYECLPESARARIAPVCLRTEEVCRAWAAEEFVSNSIDLPEDNQMVTDRGEKVRSRAELIIANMLNKLGLAYRYECRFYVNGRSAYPDFTIMHPQTGEIYYLEYFGLMDDYEYARSALKKIYQYYGTPQADKFIFIFESERVGINIPAIENMLRQKFLE